MRLESVHRTRGSPQSSWSGSHQNYRSFVHVERSLSIERWKDWFELIALVAVIGSLIAVVAELRQTQTAMQAQAYQARAFNGIEWNMELARDESLRSMQAQLDSDDFSPATLSQSELSLAKCLMTITRIDLDNEHFQYQSGLLDPGFYDGETVKWIKHAAPIWRELGDLSPRPEFRAEVDRILADDSTTVPEQ